MQVIELEERADLILAYKYCAMRLPVCESNKRCILYRSAQNTSVYRLDNGASLKGIPAPTQKSLCNGNHFRSIGSYTILTMLETRATDYDVSNIETFDELCAERITMKTP